MRMSDQTLHVSISAEPIFRVFGLEISNSIFTSLIVSFLLIAFAIFFKKYKFQNTDKPGSLQNFVEMIVDALYNFVYSVTENTKKTFLFFPIIATFFIFIILNNYAGLLPGVGSIMTHEVETVSMVPAQAMASEEAVAGAEPLHVKMVPLFRAATADLNTTLALAIISVALTQIFGITHLGSSYFKKFIDFSNPINFFVGMLELILEFAKIVSFAFRLFGNIFAGEVLLAVMAYLVAVAAPTPFFALELFVGFIQALVFSMLSLIFFNLATKGHHEEDHAAA